MGAGDKLDHHVERGQPPGAGDAVSIHHEQCPFDLKVRKLLDECRDVFPMDGAAAAFQQAGMRQDIGTAGHAADVDPAVGQTAQGGEGEGMVELRRVAAGADEQGVQFQVGRKAVVERENDAVRGG